jgi:hypothetical protein
MSDTIKKAKGGGMGVKNKIPKKMAKAPRYKDHKLEVSNN